ncbi:hypothetical protein DEJ16_03370 [Curtobacterium sp. MCJR17_055]|nr:hypothetical protein DEI87_11190 [Curtobacterium sp. MCBD17_029]PYY58717.1 hypothetical protein DEJ16_03370 [Curtobacterium sp. MCJR17_055]PYY59742.1 hypothetical protein DEJ26_07535 [Curtobacterium sp. MCPF17_015]PZE91697.1 hypothetical protein DEI95_10010 [Curtobacterium sp. MCBD17_008]
MGEPPDDADHPRQPVFLRTRPEGLADGRGQDDTGPTIRRRDEQMSQSTPSGRRDAHRLSSDEAEVREALLDHDADPHLTWVTAQLDGTEEHPLVE